MNSYILYVIGLQDIQSKFFVYYTQTEDFNKVMMECALLFEFPQKYKPINIVEQSWNQTVMDVDKYVKKYMFDYGIENVRGGSYKSIILSDEQINSIKLEYTYINEEIEKEKDLRYFLYNMINTQDKTKLNNLTSQFITMNEELQEKTSFLKKLEIYEYKKNKNIFIEPILNNIGKIVDVIKYCYFYPENFESTCEDFTNEMIFKPLKNSNVSFECIDNQIPSMIRNDSLKEDPITNIQDYKPHDFENKINSIKEIYITSLSGIKYILKIAPTIYPNLKYDSNYQSLKYYFLYPEFLLDSFILHYKHYNKIDDFKKKILDNWCNCVSGIHYFFLNRIQELKFDISKLPLNLEWKLQTICHKLDYIPLNEND